MIIEGAPSQELWKLIKTTRHKLTKGSVFKLGRITFKVNEVSKQARLSTKPHFSSTCARAVDQRWRLGTAPVLAQANQISVLGTAAQDLLKHTSQPAKLPHHSQKLLR